MKIVKEELAKVPDKMDESLANEMIGLINEMGPATFETMVEKMLCEMGYEDDIVNRPPADACDNLHSAETN